MMINKHEYNHLFSISGGTNRNKMVIYKYLIIIQKTINKKGKTKKISIQTKKITNRAIYMCNKNPH